jgi:predicted nuclease with TOPRIM domain
MKIDEKTLIDERKVLETDFNTMKDRIKQVEKDLGTMKSNLNALYGAIQQVDRLLAKLRGAADNKQMPAEKEKAFNLATS